MDLEDIPLAAGPVDVVISNCVINLAAKAKVLAEAARVRRACRDRRRCCVKPAAG
jgi:hypothetical protein